MAESTNQAPPLISFKILQTYLPTYIPNDDTFDQISCLLKEREIEREGRRLDELEGDEDQDHDQWQGAKTKKTFIFAIFANLMLQNLDHFDESSLVAPRSIFELQCFALFNF